MRQCGSSAGSLWRAASEAAASTSQSQAQATPLGLLRRWLHGGPNPTPRGRPQIPAQPRGGRPGPTGEVSAGEAFLRSRWPYLAVLGGGASAALAYSVFREPAVTQRVWLDFEVDGAPAGRVVVGLCGRDAPNTAENFAALASHARGFGYRGVPVHRLMRGWSVWTGDVTRGDGGGGVAATGPSLGVETSGVRHRRGTVSMVLDEDGRIRSQFFFTLVTTPALDRGYMKAAAFGRVLEGIEVLERLSRLPTRPEGREGGGAWARPPGAGAEGDAEADARAEAAEAAAGRPLADVRIADCGVLPGSG
ncbi:hypothetical protein HYH03_016769 [Edaphochlamys debaryana]|uniref:PPIase cyclophilin-type domain-containing protein n=1 Tax=Edaphochlamys debaryana TaxID=47281 RepID=A0A835XJ44_9CHLO|nr:hypothetical protein HYH03_016769 [Edaphochlamys debaryana]|eukprot:KAG2484350.1 hypothetical protein HYH03_016769 [Edaphochlamys debaryana]